jgi:hypothetical protein
MIYDEYFYSVVTEYCRATLFEQAELEEIPENLRVEEMIFCYRKLYNVKDKQLVAVDINAEEQIGDIYIFVYVLKNSPRLLKFIANYPDKQKYVSTDLDRQCILMTPIDVIKETIEALVRELFLITSDEYKFTFNYDYKQDG